MNPDLTIIIPTFNRKISLRNCIESVRSQTHHNIEIIVVDNGSTDGTIEALRKISDSRVSVIELPKNAGAASARNEGIKRAYSSLIAFLDDDCVASPEWAGCLIQSFQKPKTDVVIGRTFYVRENFRAHFPDRMVGNNHGTWPGAGNIAFRSHVFSALRGFSPEFEKLKNEDTELALRAVAQNFHFIQAPQVKVFHERQWWTAASLLASAKNASVWPRLKKMYPKCYQTFGGPVKFGFVIDPREYLLLLFLPIVIPIQLVRYLLAGNKNLALFFAKWPIWLILKRLLIWREALRFRVLLI